MITRIEIDGFKSFLDFELDVPPFLALVGPNSSGKSNLFDALEFLRTPGAGEESRLASRRGLPHELFHQGSKGRPLSACGIEVRALAGVGAGLVPFSVWQGAEIGDDDVPYACTGRVSPVGDVAGLPGWVIHRLEEVPAEFGGSSFGGSEERDSTGQYFRLVVSELTSWHHHRPVPELLRSRSSAADDGPLRPDGSNLATVLGRLKGRGAIEALLVDLTALIPDLAGIEPILDDRRQEWTFDVIVDGQGAIPGTLLSDGTLRVIALLAALHDPDHAGVLLIEEIENGLHPSRLAELLRRIQGGVTDLNDPECVNRPLRQVILTTHSPVVVSELYRLRPDALVFFDTAVRVDPDNDRISRVTVAKPVRSEGEPGTFVSPRQVRKYLSAVGQVP